MTRSVAFEYRRFTPNSGDTIGWVETFDDVFNIIDNPAALASLTIDLPVNPEHGQIFMVSVRSLILQLTFNDQGKPVRRLASSLGAGGIIGWYYDEISDAWYTYLPAAVGVFPIQVQALTSGPVDSQTAYFGNLPKAPTATVGISKIYPAQAGRITRAVIYCYAGTAGTAEAWSLYIRKNGTTDHLIATIAAATNERIFSNTNLNILMQADDYVEIKMVNPAWATNPATAIFGGTLNLEYNA
jgi:hypothetical protein